MKKIKQVASNRLFNFCIVLSLFFWWGAIEFFIENEQVKSVATSDEERKKLIDSLTTSALEKIATSTATDPNSKVLQELAAAIIDDVEVSAATSEEYSYKVSKTPYVSDPGFSQATTNKSAFNSTAFNFLNN